MMGARPPLPGYPRAPIADIIPASIDGLAVIYSMFRIRKGYAGPCRRVRRLTDNAERDIGFTAGGFYNIKEELAWAGSVTTAVIRWYNQSSAAGIGLNPAYIYDAGTSPPQGASAVNGVWTFAGYPSVRMVDNSSLRPDENMLILNDGAGIVSSVWIGGDVVFATSDSLATLYSVNASGQRFGMKARASDGKMDDGFIFGNANLVTTHPSNNALNSIIVTTGVSDTGFINYFINGASQQTSGIILELGQAGIAQLFGRSSENRVHTFIADGSSGLAIRDLAVFSFNADNWIHP